MSKNVEFPQELINSSILIVDDMSFYLSILGQAITNFGFQGELLKANKLADAFEIVNSQYQKGKTIGLIICDLHLPDGEGTKLSKKLREIEVLSKIPFLLITTEDHSQTIIKAFENGVDNFIFKPLDDKILLEKIVHAFEKYNRKKK